MKLRNHLFLGGGEIYYTLDGSEPTCHSKKYEDPIYISDASFNDNAYSMRTDVSTGFQKELIEEYSSNYPNYKIPNYLVDKCTVVRAVIYYGNDIYSSIKTASYFVGFNNKNGYDGMNVVSIVTDPDNLFDYDDGIYVTGKAFDDFKEDELGKEESWATSYWWIWYSNYSKRGREAERIASCQFFSEGELVLSQQCGIRIHGGGSRGNNPKSLNLYARSEYSRNDYFCYNFFDNEYYASRLTLFQGGDDDKSKMQDYLINKLTENLSFCTMDFEPYILFLDGEYWGVYWLTEKYDERYISYHYNVLPDNIIIMKNGKLEVGEESDTRLYQEMIEFCTTADLSSQENYKRVCEMIDIDSFIDYYATMIYIGRNNDWPGQNEAIWRSRKLDTGKYNDGKWRWMLFDVNSGGMSGDLIEFDSYENTLNYEFFSNLMSNVELRNRLLERVEELGQTNFSQSNVENAITEFRVLMDEPMKQNCKRFWGNNAYTFYLDKVADVQNFMTKRHEYISIMVKKVQL